MRSHVAAAGWRVLAACGLWIAVIAVLAGTAPRGVRAEAADEGSWNPKAAAGYLDGRAAWWAGWPNAARDHGTFCVSCHTALPYALARPALRRSLGEREPAPAEVRLLDNVVKRVTLWRDVAPFYPDQARGLPKTSESRGTESILNAIILAGRDAERGHLSDEGRAIKEIGRPYEDWCLVLDSETTTDGALALRFGVLPGES